MSESTTITRLTPAIGDVVVDTSTPDATGPRYAIGKTGFLALDSGDFLPYDSAFPGPQFFDRPEFIIEGSKSEATQYGDTLPDGAARALAETDYRLHRLCDAKTVMEQAETLINLKNAMSDLRSWHPGYTFDDRYGGTLPWERAADPTMGG